MKGARRVARPVSQGQEEQRSQEGVDRPERRRRLAESLNQRENTAQPVQNTYQLEGRSDPENGARESFDDVILLVVELVLGLRTHCILVDKKTGKDHHFSRTARESLPALLSPAKHFSLKRSFPDDPFADLG